MATKPLPRSVSIIRQILRAEILLGIGFLAGCAVGPFVASIAPAMSKVTLIQMF